MIERTLCIVKPDAVAKQSTGAILARIEESGLRLIACRMVKLSKDDAGRFYAVHRERPFYGELTDFMSSGPIVVCVLEGEGAIGKWRDLMGATDPAKAPEGSIRREFGTNVERNATHGSDAPETARWEIGFFFGERELRPD
jgi:nucleoside-diphosphate kinase